jgi:predicted MFS family arabinose efflux permease
MLLGGLTRDRDFLKLWSGQAISKIGSTITSVGIPLTAAYVLKASPFQMGALTGLSGAGVLVFGLFAGAWADRLRRRPILIATDLARAALLGTIPLAAALHRLNMAHLYTVASLAGILTVLFDVSYQAYVPSLVNRENLVEANSKLALTESIADVTGPGLTGLLIKLITAPTAILLDAVSFLCSAVSVWLIRKPEPQPVPGLAPHIRREIAEGLSASWCNPLLRALLQRAATGPFFLGFIGGQYFLFAVRDLHLTPVPLGIIVSVGGASNLFGALLAQRLVHRHGLGRNLIAAVWITAFAMLMIPLAHGSVALCTAFLIASQLGDMAWPIYHINEISLRQAVTPDRLLGRVNSASHLLFQGAIAMGAFAGGAIADSIGIRQTMLMGTLGYTLSCLWLTFSPIRHLRELPVAQDAEGQESLATEEHG